MRGVFANSQMTLLTPAGPDAFRVVGFTARERLSALSAVDVELLAPSGAPVPLDELVGRPAALVLRLPGGVVRHFGGICSRVSQGDATRETTSYRAEVVPWLWLLGRRSDNRPFLELSVPEIVQRVLDAGPTVQALTRSYGRRDYCVQYRETDFDFAARLMEEEGIFWFFRQEDEQAATLVLADDSASLPGEPVAARYDREGALRKGAPAIFEWTKRQELTPGKVTLRGHAFELPETDEATATIQAAVQVGAVEHRLAVAANERLELYDYPGDYAHRFDGGAEVPPAGERAAQVRMEAETARAIEVSGASTVFALAPGRPLVVRDHPHADGEYVVTSVSHSAQAEGDRVAYRNAFTCIPAGLPFRPERTRPKPFAASERAVVTQGPDPLGRVKVTFPWMRAETSSDWTRVLAPPGFSALPEVGDEVLVAFQHGDPDRPVIVGALWNPDGRSE